MTTHHIIFFFLVFFFHLPKSGEGTSTAAADRKLPRLSRELGTYNPIYLATIEE